MGAELMRNGSSDVLPHRKVTTENDAAAHISGGKRERSLAACTIKK